MKAVLYFFLFFIIVHSCLSRSNGICSSNVAEEDVYQSQVVGVDDVIRVSADQDFPMCKVNLELRLRGCVKVTTISTSSLAIISQNEEELSPENISVYRPEHGKALCVSWRNQTHDSLSVCIDPIKRFKLKDLRYTTEYKEKSNQGLFNIDMTWSNPLHDVGRDSACWVSSSQATCRVINATAMRIDSISSRRAVTSPIIVKVRVDSYCTVPLFPIHIKYTDCPKGSKACLPLCIKPDHQVNAKANITGDNLIVKWLPPPGATKQQVAAYAIRWGYAYFPEESPDQFKETEDFLWKEPDIEEVQNVTFELDHLREDDIIVQVVPLCHEKLAKLHELDNCTNLYNEPCNQLFNSIFLPDRVNARISLGAIELESSQQVEQGSVASVTVLGNSDIVNNTLDPTVDVVTYHVTKKPEFDGKKKWVGVIIPIVSVGLLLCFILITALLCSRRRKQRQNTKNLGNLLQPNPLYNSLYKNIGEADKWEITPRSLEWGSEVGCGAFGSVYKCVLRDETTLDGNEIKTVAVKTLTGENCSGLAKQQFIQEMLVMKELSGHPNIVQLVGCITLSEPFCLLTEFAVNGDLLSYLHSIRPAVADDDEGMKELEYSRLIQMSLEIASGMEYVSLKGYVHRDLAARNLLLDSSYTVKIADFGLARYLHSEDVYVVNNSKRLPVKWLSVEALVDLVFSTASDVWAFGVVLYELVTLGETPYPTIDPTDVRDYLSRGYRMDRPSGCDLALYDIMASCWKTKPSDRPTFSELLCMLTELYQDYKSIERANLFSDEIFDVDEGFAADCASVYRSHLPSESSNFSDVSMIIASPQLTHKFVTIDNSVNIGQSASPAHGEAEIVYSQASLVTRL